MENLNKDSDLLFAIALDASIPAQGHITDDDTAAILNGEATEDLIDRVGQHLLQCRQCSYIIGDALALEAAGEFDEIVSGSNVMSFFDVTEKKYTLAAGDEAEPGLPCTVEVRDETGAPKFAFTIDHLGHMVLAAKLTDASEVDPDGVSIHLENPPRDILLVPGKSARLADLPDLGLTHNSSIDEVRTALSHIGLHIGKE